ncbi:sphingosine 1-phosphate receptor 3-like [Anneissia japonica]|uniref:sphingosine 1-phosphate receptor 3-like n=1 Tax=Anneissia japonica TaxID=1529436 RepID=UPI00142566DC|nr:sphingosine 1-phosphate receptor 3-like [Anneissia japonica]
MNSTEFDPSTCTLPSIADTPLIYYPSLLSFYITMLIILCVLITLGNCIIIWAFIHVKKLRDKKYVLIGSLCLTDFLTGIILPIQILAPPSFVDAIGLSLAIISVFTILAIAIERFYILVLMNVDMSRTAATGRQLILICILMWLTVFLVVVPWTAYPRKYIILLYSFAPLSVIVVMIGVSVLYASIFHTMHKMDKKKQSKLGKRSLNRTKLVIQAYAIIVVMFSVCWLPWCIEALRTAFDTYFSSNPADREVCYVATIPAIFLLNLGLLNSAINPLIYWLKLPDFHDAINRLPIFKCFTCKSCQKRSAISRSDSSFSNSGSVMNTVAVQINEVTNS